MILDTTTRKLQIVLTGAKTTLDMPVVVDWVDNTTTTFTPGVTPTTTNGVSLVDILAAPAAATQRKVNGLTIVNLDTAVKTVQVFLNDNGTSYQIQSQVLQIGDILCYTDAHGWYTKDSSGSIKGVGPTGATGSSGSNGATGKDGAIGIGLDGTDGEDGQAIPGNIGLTGPTGLTGSTGSVGATGPQGIPSNNWGQDGEDGEMGFPGPPGVASSGGSTGGDILRTQIFS
jgi:hypothetical protein